MLTKLKDRLMANQTVFAMRRQSGLWARDLFQGITVNPERQAQLLARPPAGRTYGILFTPRSGSSMLADLMTATGIMGRPGEPFNTSFVARMAAKLESPDIATYCEMLRRDRALNGVFGFELTYDHMRAAFKDHDEARRLLQATTWFWLIREDLVAQAISLSRLKQTRMGHDRGQLDAAARAEAEEKFQYDPVGIRRRLTALRFLETGTEAFFAEAGPAPLRLSYERITQLAPAALAQVAAGHLGIALPATAQAATTHRKLATSKSDVFARQFREEHARLIDRIDRDRRPLLAALAEMPH